MITSSCDLTLPDARHVRDALCNGLIKQLYNAKREELSSLRATTTVSITFMKLLKNAEGANFTLLRYHATSLRMYVYMCVCV